MDRIGKELAQAMKALGDESRFRMLSLLLAHDLCVRALAQRLDLSESAVSQHLKVLREAGLVRGEKRGYFTHYVVERERLAEMGALLKALAATEKTACEPGEACPKAGAGTPSDQE